MIIDADMNWLASVLLASVRVGALLLLTPILAMTRAPQQFRMLFVLALSAVLVSGLAVPLQPVEMTLGGLFEAVVHELLVGGLMAFGLFAAFGAFLLGGRILDFQMGFGVANLIDPATNTQTAMMGVILNMIALMFFFAIDGHHILIRGIAYSFEMIPLGSGVSELNIAAIVSQFGAMFIFAVMIVAPGILSILLLDIGLGVMARTMPQVNVFFVSIPLKVFVGLTMTALSINNMAPIMKKIFESIFYYWQDALG